MTDAGFELPGGRTIELPHLLVLLIQMGVFLTKVLIVCSFQILCATLPRFRYDQLLKFA